VSDEFRLRGRYYTVVSVLGGIVAYYLSTQVTNTDVQHAFRDIAIAVAVGIYLMWTLERLNAAKVETQVQDYVKVVGDNFIKAVYGTELPSELFKAVKVSIFEKPFIRTAYIADARLYDLTPAYISGSSGFSVGRDRGLHSGSRSPS
jgi:hypothetical protein